MLLPTKTQRKRLDQDIRDQENRGYVLTDKEVKFVKKKFEMFGGIISVSIEKDLNKCAHCGCVVYRGNMGVITREKQPLLHGLS